MGADVIIDDYPPLQFSWLCTIDSYLPGDNRYHTAHIARTGCLHPLAHVPRDPDPCKPRVPCGLFVPNPLIAR